MTPLLWLLWWAAIGCSFSRMSNLRWGYRCAVPLAVAEPAIPAPMITRSHCSTGWTALHYIDMTNFVGELHCRGLTGLYVAGLRQPRYQHLLMGAQKHAILFMALRSGLRYRPWNPLAGHFVEKAYNATV